jgi:hypothetical protein
MSSADDDMATAESPAERYAAGRMRDAEELEFEVLMLERPDVASEVDAVHRIRAGLRELQVRGELERLLNRPRTHVPAFALAAGVAALVVSAAVLLHSSYFHRLPTVIATSVADFGRPLSSPPHVASFLVAHTRGSDEPTPITVSDSSQIVALQILPSLPSTTPTYRITLERMTNGTATPVARDVEAPTGADGFVRVYVEPSNLPDGVYRLSILQPASAEHFALRISRSR